MAHVHSTYLARTHHIFLAAGALILAISPVLWLVRSWFDPAYASFGWVFFLVVCAMFMLSLSTPTMAPTKGVSAAPVILLLVAALIRLAGQLLAINTLSALSLCIDVYALARLSGLDTRARAFSPFWVAVVFFFALPVERLLQRSVGYGLQSLSAEGACGLLSLFFSDTTCAGVQITVRGQMILVDLPCAGTVGLTLVAALYAVAAAVIRPGLRTALIGAALIPVACVAANTVRITGLSVGLVLAPIDVMAEPWHSVIGLVTLALSALPPLAWLARGRSATTRTWSLTLPNLSPRVVFVFPLLALVIIALPHRPLDTSGQVPDAHLPSALGGHLRQPKALSPQEAAYFQQYGGSAAKAYFGPMGLLLTHTKSPLRHLHDPEDCLRGLGFDVQFIGTRTAPIPTTIYRVTDDQGRVWRAEVSFFSDQGHVVPSVSAAVWHWLARPRAVWSGLQRITPWDLPGDDRTQLELAAIRALDITEISTKGPTS